MRSWSKVFEVGFSKMGTTSLGRAFEILGLRHKGWDESLVAKYNEGKIEELLKLAENFDAFEDAPWHNQLFFKILDKEFPNSKFILLERDMSSWVKSVEAHKSRHFSKEEREYLILRNSNKRKEIKKYFRDRTNDLLIMNICEGYGWNMLCPFLGLPHPNVPFPHENKTQSI